MFTEKTTSSIFIIFVSSISIFFLIDDFKEAVSIGTRFLDNVVDYNMNRHALEDQKENATKDRRVGLGILGLGDMLVRMGIQYDSEDALQTIEQIMQILSLIHISEPTRPY